MLSLRCSKLQFCHFHPSQFPFTSHPNSAILTYMPSQLPKDACPTPFWTSNSCHCPQTAPHIYYLTFCSPKMSNSLIELFKRNKSTKWKTEILKVVNKCPRRTFSAKRHTKRVKHKWQLWNCFRLSFSLATVWPVYPITLLLNESLFRSTVYTVVEFSIHKEVLQLPASFCCFTP